MPKYIFVTGGVVSSVGKGITAAAIGRVMKSRGVSVTIQKLDPYLNVDPGTMSPYQHGEVYVTADGAETDLDLGHYERFIDQDLTGASSVTTGQIYQAIIQKERRGDFLGGTIQSVPHVTNEIKARVREVAKRSGADLIIVEVGGTVGDIEGQPFLEAIRQLRKEEGHDGTLAIHVTLLPHISTTNELKTKPTQHSVRELRSMGISPDVIVCRSDFPVPNDIKDKIALFCDVEKRAVIPLQTVPTIYQVPLVLQESGLGDYIVERLGLPASGRDLAEWRELVDRLRNPRGELVVGIVGKYVELHDAYLSVKESLIHAGVHHGMAIRIKWIHAEEMERPGAEQHLEGLDAVVVPGGFGERGIEGKIKAARWARENKVPYLGLCLGMQVMVIEFARNVLGLDRANSTEFDDATPYPVISMLSEQLGIVDKGGTMRLGEYPCVLVPGTKAAVAYGVPDARERHRHRYEFNNAYREQLERVGLIASGHSPDGSLVEISELRDHPWMAGSQFHPEFRSRPTQPHPLFGGLIAAAVARCAGGAVHAPSASPQLV